MRLTEETAGRLADAIEELSSINVTGLDEVWGTLGYLTNELREWRRVYCKQHGIEFREA